MGSQTAPTNLTQKADRRANLVLALAIVLFAWSIQASGEPSIVVRPQTSLNNVQLPDALSLNFPLMSTQSTNHPEKRIRVRTCEVILLPLCDSCSAKSFAMIAQRGHAADTRVVLAQDDLGAARDFLAKYPTLRGSQIEMATDVLGIGGEHLSHAPLSKTYLIQERQPDGMVRLDAIREEQN